MTYHLAVRCKLMCALFGWYPALCRFPRFFADGRTEPNLDDYGQAMVTLGLDTSAVDIWLELVSACLDGHLPANRNAPSSPLFRSFSLSVRVRWSI